jgi:hypothetical protein
MRAQSILVLTTALTGVVGGCKNAADTDHPSVTDTEHPQATDTSHPPVDDADAPPVQSGHSPHVEQPFVVTVASFSPTDHLVDECDGIVISPVGVDTGPLVEALLKDRAGMGRIDRPCVVAFSTMTSPILAKCDITTRVPCKLDGGDTVCELGETKRYYNPAVADSDQHKQDCLAMKGQWLAIPRYSRTYREAAAARPGPGQTAEP